MDEPLRSLPARFVFLITAILIYAFSGSPTPDEPGLAELSIAVLLLLGALPGLCAFSAPVVFKVFFLFGISVPVLIASIKGHDLYLVARDVVPFLFLCLPLFFTSVIAKTETRQMIFVGVLVVLGVTFCLRALAPAYGYAAPAGELYYLSNAPTVLFTAIFLGGLAIRNLAASLTLKRAACAGLAAAGVLIILWAMLLDIQRATIFSIAISMAAFLLTVFVRAPRRSVIPLLAIITLTCLFYPVFQEAIHAMADKTARVGLNMRTEELKAVLSAISVSPVSAFLGLGWGAKMASPAVGGIEVAFTHSLLTYMLLKTGLCGLGLTVWLVADCLRNIISLGRRDIVMAIALFWALVIPVFFYASHKSLDFGLILLLIAVLADGFHGRVASVKTPV